MGNTIFFYDWNVNEVGFVWPGLIYADDFSPYCRADLSDDELSQAEDEGDTVFNDDDTRDYTWLNASVLSNDVYKNDDLVWVVKVKPLNDFTKADGTVVKSTDYITYNYAQLKNVPLTLWDKKDYQIVGIAADGTVLDTNKCTTNYISFDDSLKKFCFLVNGNKYYFHSLNPDYALTIQNNLAVVDEYNTVYLFCACIDSEQNTVCNVRYSKKNSETNETPDVIIHTSEVVAMYAEVSSADSLTYYEITDDTKTPPVISVSTFYRVDKTSGNYWAWSKNIRKIYDNDDAGQTLAEALADPTNIWKTPREYYSTQQSEGTSKISRGKNGYMLARVNKKDEEEKKTVPTWWWCNSLRNWCTFKYTKKICVELFVWNGKNGWDPFKKIMLPSTYGSYVRKKYFYDIRRFTRGAYFNAKIKYDNMQFRYCSVRLPEDSKFSNYDDDTFQTVKIGSEYTKANNTRRYPFTVGIPPVMRLPSGELQLIYDLKLPGMDKKREVIRKENMDFINSVCVAYFGSGDDKTIFDNWKNFEHVKDTSEERATEVITDSKSTLVYQDEINTISEVNDGLNITFTIPRQYPSTVNADAESYAEEWSK